MNKSGYFYGNPFKVYFRPHHCFRCGNKLRFRTHRKIIHQSSAEAKFYDFSIPVEGRMIGPCEFIHSVFHCEQCEKDIEFNTQTSVEDIAITVNRLNLLLHRHNQGSIIRMLFETTTHTIVDKIEEIQDVNALHLMLVNGDKEEDLLTLPKLNNRLWERPAYFRIIFAQLRMLRKRITESIRD